jgi:hypothetical protein
MSFFEGMIEAKWRERGMVKDIDKIAARLGARVVCRVPDVGGGASVWPAGRASWRRCKSSFSPVRERPPRSDAETDLEQSTRSALS